ncbi:hypothetical protein SARC_05650 [Sphaeroforma arctica JP610]|uniref:RING-type domain-containing protein n=1 Tax=Sphaeroforma arctica JP610 TaxID=667725 RepID=A0A0L0FZR1_9EUKA|nr:hypothetical protein SARC_05650 [Sphaeroforma arctica JP610]KNC82056.1 hypothetical protein SARC_05650 [Sphaeroforma arctica JP610]|eukprot:XP_014155958.1 hypothetical protein SARC_05650 [Sphaeroforma arctica JP610]
MLNDSARLVFTEDTIKCPICLSVPTAPVQIGCCPAVFCKIHILTWLKTHQTCPSCRRERQEATIVEKSECTLRVANMSAKCVKCGLAGTMKELTDTHSEAVCMAAVRSTTPMRLLCKYKLLNVGDVVDVFFSYGEWSYYVERLNETVIKHIPSNYLEACTVPLERELTLREMNECVASCPEIDPLLKTWFEDRVGWVDKLHKLVAHKDFPSRRLVVDGKELDVVEIIKMNMFVFKTDSQVLQTCFSAAAGCLDDGGLRASLTCCMSMYISIRDAMRKFPNRSALQKGALMLLQKMSDRILTTGPHYLTECDVLVTVVDAMQRFPYIREIQLHSCYIMINAVMGRSVSATILIDDMEIQEHIQTLLERSSLWPDVLLGVCTLVSDLCELRKEFVDAMHIALNPFHILRASKQFRSPREYLAGIHAFLVLSNTSEELEDWAGDETPDTSVITAAALYPDYADLQIVAFEAIKALCNFNSEGLAGFSKEALLAHIKRLEVHHQDNDQLMDLVDDVRDLAREAPASRKRKITKVGSESECTTSHKHAK